MIRPCMSTWLPEAGGEAGDVAADLLDLLPAGRRELIELYDGLWDAGVDPVVLELCRLRLAMLLDSPLDRDSRDPRAVAAGLREQQVEALAAWPMSPLFSAATRAALAYTEQFVLDPHGFSDEDSRMLHEHFSDPQLATLTIAVAAFDARTRVHRLLAVEAGQTRLATRTVDVEVALSRKDR